MASSKKPTLSIPPPPAKPRWVASAIPSVDELERAPVGTAFAFKEEPGSYHVKIKVQPNRWLQTSGRTVSQAVEEWKQHAASPPQGSGYFVDDRFALLWLTKRPREPEIIESFKKLSLA
jgi:hypothetical protein